MSLVSLSAIISILLDFSRLDTPGSCFSMIVNPLIPRIFLDKGIHKLALRIMELSGKI
jgi:hypothetical protein